MDPKPRPEPVTYVCGECGQESTQNLVPGETIKCPSCLFGVLYKKRTRKTPSTTISYRNSEPSSSLSSSYCKRSGYPCYGSFFRNLYHFQHCPV